MIDDGTDLFDCRYLPAILPYVGKPWRTRSEPICEILERNLDARSREILLQALASKFVALTVQLGGVREKCLPEVESHAGDFKPRRQTDTA